MVAGSHFLLMNKAIVRQPWVFSVIHNFSSHIVLQKGTHTQAHAKYADIVHYYNLRPWSLQSIMSYMHLNIQDRINIKKINKEVGMLLLKKELIQVE